MFSALADVGFTFEESVALRRISMTLNRWNTDECNGDIQRNEVDGKPARYLRTGPSSARYHAYAIPDREAGALSRLRKIVAARNHRARLAKTFQKRELVVPYHQGDPRGASLYIVPATYLADSKIEEVYHRGIAIHK